jgi:hypothetical protein
MRIGIVMIAVMRPVMARVVTCRRRWRGMTAVHLLRGQDAAQGQQYQQQADDEDAGYTHGAARPTSLDQALLAG